jgi:hypothetical protein
MKVFTERHVEQVQDGTHYRGHVKFGDIQFEYELRLAVPIPKLDDMKEPPEEVSAIRRLFQITVKKGEESIELTDDEYSFFFHLLGEFVVNFYNDPQTRDSQEGLMGQMVRGEGLAAVFGSSAKIGITSSGSYDFNPELCEMLNAPKFGCALVA